MGRSRRADTAGPASRAPGGADPPDPPLRIALLGGFRATLGEHPIDAAAWRLQKARSLVKLLALAPGHRLGREQIADLLWPHLDSGAAGNNLHRTLHAARHALAGDQPGRGAGPLLLEAGVVALRPAGPLWVDVAAFESAAASARRTRAVADYQAALDLYAGELLPEDRYEDWAAGRREALRETYLGLLLDLACLHEGRGDWAQGIAALERLVAEEPAHEDGHVGLMRLHAHAGQRGQALRQWAHLEEALRRDLDAESGADGRRLYAEILAGRFPPAVPPRTPGPAAQSAVPRDNLPVPLTSFIGRAREVAALDALLHATRLLTLIGPGGCGKTRLALAVATAIAAKGRFPDGVWLVELATLADPALLPGAVAGALGVREGSASAPLDALTGAVREKALLLVLDNCEHLADACAHLAGTLLGAAPDLRILATSRAALRAPGEVTWTVPPLQVPDARGVPPLDTLAASEAVALFVDRVRWRRPGFALTARDAPAVAEICRRLEGQPLALELAAARAALLSPAQLAARLDDALAVLSGGDRTAPPRQRTLRATLDWSHALLAPAERALLRRLAVFAGGWTLEAAEAICGDDEVPEGDILVLLAGLVDQSLVQVEEDATALAVRYRLLEPVRQYARERLAAAGEADRLGARHAAYYLALAERVEPALAGPEQGVWLDRLGGEYGNLRGTLEWTAARGSADMALRLGGALWRYWSIRGPCSEGRAWLARLLARSGAAGDPAVRAKALASAGLLAHQQGDYGAARPLFAECIAIRRAQGDPGAIARALTNLAFVIEDRARAAELLDEALALGRAAGDRASILRTLNTLGELAREQGAYDRALACYEESLALCRETGERLGVAHLLHNLGLLALARAEVARAATYLHEGLLVCREVGDMGLGGRYLAALAGVAGAAGEAARAARLHGAAHALRAATGMEEGEINREGARPHLLAARDSLGEATFAAALAAGRGLPPDDALAEALAFASLAAGDVCREDDTPASGPSPVTTAT